MPEFIAAQLFANIKHWLRVIEETKQQGGYVNRFAEKTVKKGEINLHDSLIFNNHKSNVRFPHRHAPEEFPNYGELCEHFRNLPENLRNYRNARERPGDMQQLINRLLKQRLLKILLPQDPNLVTLNPCNLLIKPSGKTMLLVHWLGNVAWTGPKVKLDHLSENAHRISEFETLSKTDLSNCYFQFPLCDSSQKSMAFQFNNIIYCPTAMVYGAAPNVFICQHINNIPCEYIRSKFLLFVCLYIDDFLAQKRTKLGEAVPEFGISSMDSFPLLTLLKTLNYAISESKTEIDRPQLDFTGFNINLTTKRISIKATTVVKLQTKLQETIVTDSNSNRFIETNDLESLMGSLNFCAATCELGLSRTLELMLNLNHAKKTGKHKVWLSPGMDSEIEFWRSRNPGDSMTFARYNCLHNTLYIPGTAPDLVFTDASSRMYGYKIFGQNSLIASGAGDFGFNVQEKLLEFSIIVTDELVNEAIYVKEFLVFLIAANKLQHNSAYLSLIDNQGVVSAILKTRSSNRLCNRILEELFKLLKRRNIYMRPVWINTTQMLLGGADDASRGDNRFLNQKITFSTEGVTYFKRFFPDNVHIVFGNINEAENLYPDLKFSSFHQQEHPNYSNLDPFVYLMKAYSENALSGTQVCFPPPQKNVYRF